MGRRAQLEPLRAKPSKTDTVLETTDVVVGALRGIVSVAPIPGVAEAAELVLSIVDTIKDVKDNKDAFKHLVDDAYRLVCTAADTCKRLEAGGEELPQDLYTDIAALVSTLRTIENYSLAKVKRRVTERIIFKGHDLETIRRYREELKQSLDTFNLQSTMSIRHDVAQLRRGQTQILQHFETRTDKHVSKLDGIESTTVREREIQTQYRRQSDSTDVRRSHVHDLQENGMRRRPGSTPPTSSPRNSPERSGWPSSPLSQGRPQEPRSAPASSNPNMDAILTPHLNPILRSIGVPEVNISRNPWQQTMTSPPPSAPYYNPTNSQPYHGSPFDYSGLLPQGGLNINSGTTTTTIISNSNNDYSNNVYWSGYDSDDDMPRKHKRGPSWKH